MRTRMRTAIKKVVKAVQGGDGAKARDAYRAAVPEVDTMVSKRIIHRNKAARHKSRLNKALKALPAK
jgi:small subunit ribosomal protein S20